MMGIPVFRVVTSAYVASGIAAAIAGLTLVSTNTRAIADTAYGYEMYIFIALVVGGVDFSGGKGTIQGGLYGAIFVALLTNAMTLLEIDSTYRTFIRGTIIIIALILMVRGRETSRRKVIKTNKAREEA